MSPSSPSSAPQAGAERVVVVGHGMVGHRLCERLIERAPAGKYALTVLCEELRPAYDRVHLTSYLEGLSRAAGSEAPERSNNTKWGHDLSPSTEFQLSSG